MSYSVLVIKYASLDKQGCIWWWPSLYNTTCLYGH